MAIRSVSALNTIFDVAVIGGGIHGAAIAYEAAQRGLRVALFERGDFGSETTAGNFKTLHGGLRYLQHFDLKRLYSSVTEQRYFLQHAPQLTAPLPFLVPCYGFGMKSREVLNVALKLYELLTPRRNAGLDAAHRFGRPRMLSVEETLEIAPALARRGLRGGVLFYDAIMNNSDRVTLAFVRSAEANAAVVANYHEVHGSITAGGGISQLRVKDVLTGAQHLVSAKFVVNATGPWCDLVRSKLVGEAEARPRAFSKGVQCVLPQFLGPTALAVESRYSDRTALVRRGNRSYFLLPWGDSTIVGTADSVYTENPDDMHFSEAEVRTFLSDVREVYPDRRLSIENAQFTFGGLRPVDPEIEHLLLKGESAGTVEARRRDRIEVDRCFPNLLHVEGIKYTTARRVAQRVVDSLNSRFPTLRPSVSLGTDLIASAHAARAADDAMITPSVSEADIRAAVREEYAVRLGDVVFRRTDLGARGYPGTAALLKAAEIMAVEAGWSAQTLNDELHQVLSQFQGRIYAGPVRVQIDAALEHVEQHGRSVLRSH